MNVYIYVVSRDFGFAPNPFHGVCTLATCKPKIRSVAQAGDWVIGMGGSSLKAAGRCIFAMNVTETMSFDQYWASDAYREKRPVRNGSRKMMLGDNIYHRVGEAGDWIQKDSHHSLPDGTADPTNVSNDTKVNRILISRHFIYFGCEAPLVPSELLDEIGYSNGRGHRKFDGDKCQHLLNWLLGSYGSKMNRVLGDPYQFESYGARYSAGTNRVTQQ